jgi:uncharacterized membrane protein (UPF0182 family)
MSRRLIILTGLLGLVFLWLGVSIYPDWLWFENLGFSSIFWTMLLSKFGVGALFLLLFLLIAWLNFYSARRLNPKKVPLRVFRDDERLGSQLPLSGKVLNSLVIVFILIIGFIIASGASSRWHLILRYLYQQPFGSTDPIFSKDISFFVFSLPFHLFVQGWLLGIFVFTGVVMILWYLKGEAIQVTNDLNLEEGLPTSLPKITVASGAQKHLLFLGGIILLLLAWGYRLKMYGLLYSTQGPAFGASYTDINIKILGYTVLIIASLGLASILFLNLFKPRNKLIWLSGGVWLGALLVFAIILPTLVQKVVVKPNELAKESPYIAYNIDYTRNAYNLNKVKDVSFMVQENLSADDIKKNNTTIQNIRIWDERPLLQTYRQIQSIRLYYDFSNVDVDRYMINQQYRQVMLAARELAVNQLPAQANTWVNRHLIYTHGYGLALSPVNEVTSEGLPHLLIKDLPPSFVADLNVERPEIYYGEKTDEYVLVKTKTKEFDYPKGDKNVYTIYEGRGGVPIGSFIRRVLFALEFMDPQILFTGYLGPESKIMFNRRIDRRVATIAPFLAYDGDPYLVVTEGKLYWIQDAYTTSDMYPYSQRSKIKYPRFNTKAINYIRNSVKVIIDAYNGEVTFYMMDEKDPIVKTYSRIFPALFKSLNAMPDDLKKHLRYPKDLFEIQVATYRTYHMEDPQVFYNQEDLWQIPDELYGDIRQEMEAYYIIIKLPEEEKEEFLMMIPFTPSKKDNMIGWLAARSDLPNYGSLLAYKLPKDKLVFGPMQIEARVDQQTDISRELTLWGQRGSRVIRGNLLAIPVNESFIFVEPVYLEARQEETDLSPAGAPPGRPQARQAAVSSGPGKSRTSALPELKRVIVAYGNHLTMEENLDKALGRIFGGEILPQELATSTAPPTLEVYGLAGSALEHYNKAQDHLRQGNWTEYGRELKNLEGVLQELSRTAREKE